MSATIQTSDRQIRIADGERVVTLQKLRTGTGERIEVAAPAIDSVARLDAIALESVTWQDEETLDAMAEQAQERPRDPSRIDADDDREQVESLQLTNEYAMVRLRKLTEDGTELLEIEAPKVGYTTRLSARDLEGVAVQSHETFTDFLEFPFGPDDHDH